MVYLDKAFACNCVGFKSLTAHTVVGWSCFLWPRIQLHHAFIANWFASCQFEFLSFSFPKIITEMGTSLCEVMHVSL